MTDLSKESLEEVDRLAEPAEPCEEEILGKNEGREKALKDVEAESKKEEPMLPKLSAADFRVYNSMAEHMEYFVRSAPALALNGLLKCRYSSRGLMFFL